MLGVGNFRRFATVGYLASYCPFVGTKKFSNGKCKGRGRENGDHMAMAFSSRRSAMQDR